MKDLPKIIGQRIKQARLELNMTPDEVVDRINALRPGAITRQAYYNWELGLRKPNPDNLLLVSNVLGTSTSWLSGYTNDKIGDGAKNYITANSPILTTKSGTIPVPQASGNVAYHIDYLKKRGLDANRLLSISQLDKSMHPTIEEGAEVLIDCSNTAVKGVDLFAILVGDRVWIRRIREEIDGTFTIQAMNSAEYPDNHLSRTQFEEIHVVGRVVLITHDR